jgi:LacI family transcriptional regulator
MINASLDTQPAKDRMAGYQRALEEAGIPFRDDRVIISSAGKNDGFNRDAGHESMRRLLSLTSGADRPTAVFIASDVQAIGALEAARQEGVRIPEDIAVVGFDDIELAQYAELTTMRQPMYEIGRLAMEKLIHRMKGPDTPATLTSFLPDLIIRSTCGARLRSSAAVQAERIV